METESGNPYRSTAATPPTSQTTRLMVSGVCTTFVCAILGGILGVGVGAGLGFFLPSYYRSVFGNGQDANFDPVAVGIGQGLTQGIGLGGLIGVLLVVGYSWRQKQFANMNQQSADDSARLN